MKVYFLVRFAAYYVIVLHYKVR